eukprot:360363-Chlamydomonas_euryale.AAC.2
MPRRAPVVRPKAPRAAPHCRPQATPCRASGVCMCERGGFWLQARGGRGEGQAEISVHQQRVLSSGTAATEMSHQLTSLQNHPLGVGVTPHRAGQQVAEMNCPQSRPATGWALGCTG